MPKPPPASKPSKYPIVISSNSALAPTGYGQQVAQLAPRLAKRGHSVAIASNYGQEGNIGQWNGITVLPRGFDMYSNDVIGAYHQMWTHENGGNDALVLTLFDVWVYLGHKAWEGIPRIASWVPIDHTPMPPKVLEWVKRPNVTPIAMSLFGAQELANAGIEHHYAPHAIEPTFRYSPVVKTPQGEINGREMMRVRDEFVILINAANKGQAPVAGRKSWDTNLMAVSMLMREYDDVVLYLHTERDGAMGGVNLPALLEGVGIPPEKVRFTEPFTYRMGLPQEALAAMYSSANVLLACSTGEGFGIPVIEAAACGLRTVVSNWTASPELVADGWVVDGQPGWDPQQGSWWLIPSITGTLDALRSAYEAERGPSDKQITHAAKYQADYVFNNHWKPILEALA